VAEKRCVVINVGLDRVELGIGRALASQPDLDTGELDPGFDDTGREHLAFAPGAG
jgi:hypothetical protein